VPRRLQVSATTNDSFSPTPCMVASEPESRLTKRTNGAGPRHTNAKPASVAEKPSRESDWARDHDEASAPILTSLNEVSDSNAVVVRELRPKQILAATLLVQGQQGRVVAKALNLSEETISRWRHRPEFQALMRQLLQETIDATRLGIVSLCAESIDHLRGLVRSFNDETSLKAITLVLGRVGPVLGVIGTELGESRAPIESKR